MTLRRFLASGIALASLFGAARVMAAQHCVNPGGTGGCFATIQAAVDTAADRDEIVIAAGTYVEPGVTIVGKRLSLVGAGADTTTIQAGVAVQNFARPETVISGLRIEHADGLSIESAKVSVHGCLITGAIRGVVVPNGAARSTRVNLTDSSVVGNDLGVQIGRGKARLSRSAVANNMPGGGISVRTAKLMLEDSTVSGNVRTSSNLGAGVEVGLRGSAQIRRSTIVDNHSIMGGGGLLIGSQGRALLEATVLANNTGASGPDCFTGGAIRIQLGSRGFNLVESISDCDLRPLPTDRIGQDPVLGPLQDNGGPTETHALLGGSPAIAAITRARLCRFPDQRGVARAVPCDIGAYEAP